MICPLEPCFCPEMLSSKRMFFLLNTGNLNLFLVLLLLLTMFFSHVLDSVPHISADFSLPFNFDDTAVPPDEFLDLVHPDLAPSQPVLPPQPEPSPQPDLPIVPPGLPLVRKSTRSHKTPFLSP